MAELKHTDVDATSEEPKVLLPAVSKCICSFTRSTLAQQPEERGVTAGQGRTTLLPGRLALINTEIDFLRSVLLSHPLSSLIFPRKAGIFLQFQ